MINQSIQGTIQQIQFQQSPLTLQQYQCRICLTQIKQQIDIYCSCKGHLQYVHQHCLLEWVKRGKMQTSWEQSYTTCQLCQSHIQLDVRRSCSCIKIGQLCTQIFCDPQFTDKSEAIGVLCLIIICFVIIITLIVAYLNKSADVVIVAILVGLSFVEVMSVGFFICKYMVEFHKEIIAVFPKSRTIKRRSTRQIMPL